MAVGNFKFSGKMGGNKPGDGKMTGKMGGGKMGNYKMGTSGKKYNDKAMDKKGGY